MPRRQRSIWFRSGAHNYQFRQAHTALLAKPNYRRTQKIKLRDTPSQIFDEPIWPVSKSAMHTAPSDRTATLSVSKTQLKSSVSETRNIRPHCNSLGKFPSGLYIRNRGAMNARPSARVVMLATPKLVRMVTTLRETKYLLRPVAEVRLRQRVADALRNNYTNFYKPSRSVVSVMSRRTKSTTSMKSLKSQKDWERHRLWLDSRASAKRIFRPPPRPRRKTRTIEQLMVRLGPLSEQLQRKKYFKEPEQPYVEESALEYEASERIKIMAKPRVYDPEKGPTKTFMGVTKAALNYKATPKIDALAIPIIKSKRVDTDLKENPYSINPMALKAYCSNRLKNLAMPTKRG